jgi:hypothetical protein
MYHEGGMNYAGMWEDGADDHYELEDTADKIEAQIPEALDQAFGISEWARENEEPEELSTWMNEGNQELTKQKETV